jgi:hypothetical protein
LDQPLALLKNETRTTGHWIQLELVGTASERDAIGTRIVLSAGGERFTQWVTAGDGYFCSDQAFVDFGFDHTDQIDRVEVHWPSGTRQTFLSPASGHRYLVIEGQPDVFLRSGQPE